MSDPLNCTEPETQAEILAKHRKVRDLLKITWNVFFAKFGRLRDIQLKVIPAVLQRSDLLVTAPTAGGKTEAVMAPVCELLKSERFEGLSCIYITPTRALVNDLFNRLDSQIAQLGLRLERKTADHSQLRDPNVLITTPESLESLLTFKKESLQQVRVIVIDEIHLLDGTPRGDQLRLLLARLTKYLSWVASDQPILRIALSATVSDPQRVAVAYLGEDAEIVSVSGQRPIDCNVVQSSDGRDVVDATLKGIAKFDDVQKTLVFVNRRKDVDEFTDLFRERMPDQVEVFGHHGSLSASERERVESGIRRAKMALCVATMTLEIGIDIGDVDLVVCIGPPSSLSGFLQRIGRGCRRRQSATRVLCMADDRLAEVVFKAYVSQATRHMPRAPIPPLRRSVVVQQVLSYLQQVGSRRRTMNQVESLFSCDGSPTVTPSVIQEIVYDMVGTGLLTFDAGIIGIGQAGNEFIDSPKIYSNFTAARQVAVVDSDTGQTVAYVGRVDAKRLKIAGQRYEVNAQQISGKISVRSTQSGDASSPSYATRGHFGYTSEVGRCIANYYGLDDSELIFLGSHKVFTWLGKLCNTAIAKSLEAQGIEATPKSFCLQIDAQIDTADVLKVLRTACTSPRSSEA